MNLIILKFEIKMDEHSFSSLGWHIWGTDKFSIKLRNMDDIGIFNTSLLFAEIALVKSIFYCTIEIIIS